MNQNVVHALVSGIGLNFGLMSCRHIKFDFFCPFSFESYATKATRGLHVHCIPTVNAIFVMFYFVLLSLLISFFFGQYVHALRQMFVPRNGR